MEVAMSNYNRQNPFVYLLEKKEDELTEKSRHSIKNMIILFIIMSITEILSTIVIILFKDLQVFEFAISIAIAIFILLEITNGVRSINKSNMNEMIFGDLYKDINVNQEQLLTQINNYNISIGKVEFVIESIYFFDIIYLTLLLIRLIEIFLFIFK